MQFHFVFVLFMVTIEEATKNRRKKSGREAGGIEDMKRKREGVIFEWSLAVGSEGRGAKHRACKWNVPKRDLRSGQEIKRKVLE